MDKDKAEYLRRKLNEWNKAVSDLEDANKELDTLKRIEKNHKKKKELNSKRKAEAQQRVDKIQSEVDKLTN